MIVVRILTIVTILAVVKEVPGRIPLHETKLEVIATVGLLVVTVVTGVTKVTIVTEVA